VAGYNVDQDYALTDYTFYYKKKGLNGIETNTPSKEPAKKTITEIAKEVIAGKWGVMPERKQKLEKAGYNYAKVQAKVNELLK
jgi:Cpl-7 lysozyme C-terminal domain.